MIRSASAVRQRAAVRAVGGQRVVEVAHGDDPRLARDRAFGEAERIAGAVEPLVVRRGDPGEVGQRADPPEDLARVDRVAAHRLPLALVEAARLVEDRVRHAELADVVEQRGAPQPPEPLAGHADRRADLPGKLADPASSGRRCTGSWRRSPGRRRRRSRRDTPRRPAPLRSAGISAATRASMNGDVSVSQNPGVSHARSNACTSSGSNQLPARRRTSSRAASAPAWPWKTSATWASKAIRE